MEKLAFRVFSDYVHVHVREKASPC